MINLQDVKRLAEAKLPKEIFDYIEAGADDEVSRRANESMFRRIRLLPRILVNVSEISTATNILGFASTSPLIIAPTAFHGMVHPQGELATAKAAEATGTLMIVSTMANNILEDVKKQVTHAWFQLYAYKDRAITENLVRRAEQAGYAALVLTVDCPLMGNRERDKRNGFKLPRHCIAANFLEQLQDLAYETAESTLVVHTSNYFDNTFTWHDIQWLQSITKLPLLLKGVLHPQDAQLAVQFGVAGIIVSNHGGRQVDTTPATIEILPKIVEVINGQIPVFFDGGIRRGTDIIKALALGAQAVLVGRPVLWGLAVDGEQGVETILTLLSKELALNMALCGHTCIEDVMANGKHGLYFSSEPWLESGNDSAHR